jgi:hypothetical protein
MLPLIPIILIGSAAGGAFHHLRKRRKSGLTPDQHKIYEEALRSMKSPDDLRTLADTFEKEGFKNEATMLRKRANLRSLPPDVAKARRDSFKKAMTSKDPVAVESMADAFQKEGATGAADALRKYAKTLKAS